MKKSLLLKTSAFALLSVGVMAQNPIGKPIKNNFPVQTKQAAARDYSKPSLKDGQLPQRGCATPPPSKAWDQWFNGKVENYKQEMANGKIASTSATTYTIPIVFHVVYYSASTVAEGTYPNLSQAQINSQIGILNADYAGIGYNSCQYAKMSLNGHGPFYDYAVANSLPAPDNNGTVIANSGITFCLASKNPSGTVLAEPGIDRVNCYSFTHTGYTSSDPAQTTLTANNFSTFIDAVIKPPTIWDPTRYFNVWLTDCYSGVGLLGYSTFPTGTTLTGLSGGGSGTASSTTDGCWVLASSCGNTGSDITAPYNLGRTLTHESGHYFGLRHVWGDNTSTTACSASDYCNDTPPAFQANYLPWPTAYPYVDPTVTCVDNGDGEMFMDFMDYSNDNAMWMFTTDQVTRMHTALSQCADRSGLTASSATLCSGITLTTPTAAYTNASTVCANKNVTFTDASTGGPTSWTWSVTPSTSVTINSSNLNCADAIVYFPNAGTYTVTENVANGQGTNSVSHVITVVTCTTSVCDTVNHIGTTDTLSLFNFASNGGYWAGTNNVGISALAEAYAKSDFATNSLQVKGAVIVFYRKSATVGTHGTAAHTATTLKMVNSSTNPAATAAASTVVTFSNIAAATAVKSVDYAGTPGLGYSTAIMVPYVATFATPVALTTDFFLSLTLPTTSGDTVALFTGAANHNSVCTAWADYNSAWSTYAGIGAGSYALAVFPIACPVNTTGIESNHLGSNINLFPNPNSGQFTFAISLPEATNLNFTIVNMLGQVVYTKAENNISNAVLSCDLSNLAKGIYYANITDSNNNKTVKKIIIE